VLVGTIVPIYRTGIEEKNKMSRTRVGRAHCKVFGEALDTTPFARILAVKPLWIKLVAQAQRFVLLV
jgi:hypothetical protein